MKKLILIIPVLLALSSCEVAWAQGGGLFSAGVTRIRVWPDSVVVWKNLFMRSNDIRDIGRFQFNSATKGSLGARSMWMNGDTVIFETSTGQKKFLFEDFASAKALIYDGATGVTHFQTQSGGGGGGSPAWSSITNPVTSLSLTNAFPTVFTMSPLGLSSAFSFIGANNDASPSVILEVLSKGSSSAQLPVRFLAKQGTGSEGGVELSAAGVWQKTGLGQINASQYNGNAVIAKVDMVSTTVHTNQGNAFTADQSITGASSPMLTVANSSTGHALLGQAGAGRGIQGTATTGTGIYSSVGSSGTAYDAVINSVQSWKITGTSVWSLLNLEQRTGSYALFKDATNVSTMGIKNSNVAGRLDVVYDVGGGSEGTVFRASGANIQFNEWAPLTGSSVGVASHLYPSVTQTDMLGNSNLRWRSVSVDTARVYHNVLFPDGSTIPSGYLQLTATIGSGDSVVITNALITTAWGGNANATGTPQVRGTLRIDCFSGYAVVYSDATELANTKVKVTLQKDN